MKLDASTEPMVGEMSWASTQAVVRGMFAPIRTAYQLATLRAQIATAQPLNVILGAGPLTTGGWIPTDVKMLDVTSERMWRRLFAPDSIDRLVAEHLFEHLSDSGCEAAFAECFRYLSPGGLLRIAVPDGNRRDSVYIEEVSPPRDGHQILFTVDGLRQRLVQAGFQVKPLEYFDAKGEFHCFPWSERDGLIRRSARHDRQERFKRGTLFYTSLIVDARKP